MTAAPTRPLNPFVTADQRAAADPMSSVWVSASAGSGKTKALTDRVLRLLLGGSLPQRILCLTFTRAAAAEMANRINRELGSWSMLGDEALDAVLEGLTGAPGDAARRDRARRQFAAVLDAPGGLKIMTIHAFCQSLLGRFPLEAGLAPHFEVLDERSAVELLVNAQNEIMQRARGGADPVLAEALAVVASHTSEEGFGELMTALRGARGRLRRLIRLHGGLDGLIAATDRLLDVDPETTPESITATACAEGAFNRQALGAAARALAEGSDKDRERGIVIGNWLGATEADRMAGFAAYQSIFLKADGASRAERNLITKKAQQVDAGALDTLVTEQTELARLAERRKAVRIARASAALLRLGGALLDAYDRHKMARARLDYDDLVLRAVDLLKGATDWVLYKLDRGIDHVLVDEAQDTSPEQWQVVGALAEEFFSGLGASDVERTLFVVGDEKQSIFSFQGADLRALAAMREHFATRVNEAGKGWREVDLALSFRSTAAVLSAVDAVFAGDAARDGVAFDDHPVHHDTWRTGHAGRVELWPLVSAEKDEPAAPWTAPLTRRERPSPRARLARHIAATIARWIADGERLEARGRPLRPGDVMVLVRTRTGFVEELVRALKTLGVPVAGADRMVLTDQLAVMDLMALGQFLLLPADDLTLAAVLRSPLIGFDDDQLFDLAHGRGKPSLWRTLVNRRRETPGFAAAHETLAALLAKADFVPPYELYAAVLGADGGRRKLVARLGPDANDPIDEFLSLTMDYERSGAPSLQGFLHWLEAGAVEVKRDMEQGRDAVRVMTVHGAKGLQAPIVLLPDTTALPRTGRSALLWYEADDGDAVLWPGGKAFHEARCDAARETMAMRDMQEYRRLLYVAMTRAEDRLYVCGWQGGRSVADGCWYRLVEAALADSGEAFDFDAWDGGGLRIAGRQRREPVSEAAAHAPPPPPAPLPAYARQSAPPEPAPPRPLVPSRPVLSEPAVLSPLAGGVGDVRFRRGRVIHRLLQILPDLPPDDRAAACAALLARPGERLEAAAQAAIADEVMTILGDVRFAPLFGPGSRAEVPLIGVIGDSVVAGQVDRLVVGPEEVLIVDYKTNRPPPAEEADVAPAYLAQMAAYRAVLSKIYPDKSITCALLWSDGPRLMQLSDAALSRHAP